MNLAIGSRLGVYDITAPIGHDGAGDGAHKVVFVFDFADYLRTIAPGTRITSGERQ